MAALTPSLPDLTSGGVVEVSALLGQYPHTAALKAGRVRSPRLNFNFADVMPVFPLFKQMVRQLSFDVCEMAIVTFLMAKDRGVPLVLIPAVVVGRLQHPSLVCAANAPLEVADLVGR